MASIIAQESGSNRTPAPAGSHPARCYGVIDLGTHINPQYGSKARKILIQWELPFETTTFKQERGPEPFVVSRQFSLNLDEKGNLRPFLVAWRGRDFDAQELAKFDVATLAGAPCLLTVIHKTDNGKTFANVTQASKLPKQMGDCPALHNPKVVLSLSKDYDQSVFDSLPEWIKKKIQESPEYRSIVNDTPTGNQEGKAGTSYHNGLDEDNIPF